LTTILTMAEAKETTTDGITTPENTTADSGNPIELPSKAQKTESETRQLH
jgi:hypothetical protein